ncbi:hypothetical protein, partial [Escherichia coli]|uniref:hypothetical protein n=1 Tax=Escherichia coli TaxID=562 RepID=UPI00215A5743
MELLEASASAIIKEEEDISNELQDRSHGIEPDLQHSPIHSILHRRLSPRSKVAVKRDFDMGHDNLALSLEELDPKR